MKKILGLLCLFMFLIPNNTYNNSSTAEEVANTYLTDFDVAIKLSKETKQKLVLIFSAEWCGYCDALKKDFSNIQEFDTKIVCIVDTDKEKKITRQFKVKNLPTSIILNTDTEEISRIVGYDKKSYVKWLSDNK